MFRTVGDQQALWEAVLPPELLVLPTGLARVDALLDDPAFFAPFVPGQTRALRASDRTSSRCLGCLSRLLRPSGLAAVVSVAGTSLTPSTRW